MNIIPFGSFDLTSKDIKENFKVYLEIVNTIYMLSFSTKKKEKKNRANRRTKRRFFLEKKEFWFILCGDQRLSTSPTNRRVLNIRL